MIQNFVKKILPFVVPMGVWLYLFAPILTGQILLLTEPFNLFAMVKFYLDNLRGGVFPFWNPYLLWGFPMELILNYFGYANPLWGLTFLMHAAGINLYTAFVGSILIYCLMGQWGFYFLAKEVLEDRRCAYLAFLGSLFSSIGLLQIGQLNMLLIYVPAIWFFYFAVCWLKRWEWSAWVGMIFSAMIILQSYLPLYFLILCFILIVLSLFIAPTFWMQSLRGILKFVTQYPVRILLSLIVLGAAMMPPYLTYQMSTNHDIVFPCRQSEEGIFKDGASFSQYLLTSDGGITSRMSFESLYAHEDRLLYGNDGFLYVSLFLMLTIVLGIINPLNRKIIILTLTALIVFLLLVGRASGLQAFCFQYIPFFKLMRNMHFFLPFFISLLALLAAEHLRLWGAFSQLQNVRHKWGLMILVGAVHGAVAFFLIQQPHVFWPVWVGLICSFIFFQMILWVGGMNHPVVIMMSVLAMVIQPMVLMAKHNQPSDEVPSQTLKQQVQAGPSNALFSFTRPEIDFSNLSQREKINQFYWYFQGMKDAPMIPLSCQHGFPAYWSFFFYKNFPHHLVHDYTRNKFYLYDQVALKGEDVLDIKDVVSALTKKANVAFVYNSDDHARESLRPLLKSGLTGESLAINQSWNMFVVKDFDVNSVKLVTQFTNNKFLVYNDSYSKGWKVFCNGREATSYRANIGFKGVYLPAGYNQVEWVYHPTGWWVWIMMPILYLLVLIYLLVILL